MRRLGLLLLLLPLAFAAVSQPMYKWVDEKGVTHYSETPPPDGKAQKVEVKPSGPAGGAAAPENWKQRELDARQKRLERGQREEKEKAEEHNASATRTNRCNRARRGLQVLERQVPVYEFNDKNEKVYITDEDRAREIEEWKKIIRENCE
jgi:hypothetical protein